MLGLMILACTSSTGVALRRTALYASRHLASQSSRSGGSTEDNFIVKVDPKKKALLDKLNVLTEDNELQKGIDVKTGAQLRKERKGELRKKRLQSEAIERQKELKRSGGVASAPASSSGPVKKGRFVLGNKVEVLTSTQLLELVKSTAPWLFPETAPKMVLDDEDDDEEEEDEKVVMEDSIRVKGAAADAAEKQVGSLVLASDPRGHVKLLRAFGGNIPATDKPTEQQRVDFFSLCLAAHFSTVATFVPTDVDSKIRGHCWADPDHAVLQGQFEVLKQALRWDARQVSTRTIQVDGVPGVLSGHDGEWLGVLCGAWGAFLKQGMAKEAREAEELIMAELQREADAFALLRQAAGSSAENDLLLLKAAAIITHNVGDVDQGLSYWYDEEDARTPVPALLIENKLRVSRLAHERGLDRFNGEFLRAKHVYKELLSAEGHRHYPLREARCLRRAPELQLPLGPWLESWGRSVASHPGLGYEDKLSVLKQLLRGCDSTSRAWCVPGQVGYYRALNGFNQVLPLERASRDLGPEAAVLKDHTTRMHLGLSERAFADKLQQRARDVLDEFSF